MLANHSLNYSFHVRLFLFTLTTPALGLSLLYLLPRIKHQNVEDATLIKTPRISADAK